MLREIKALRLTGRHARPSTAMEATMAQTQFVIADGGHARWVVRAGQDQYVTTAEQTASFRGPEPPEGKSFAAGAGRGEEDFAKELAEAINARAAPHGFDRLVLVAPAHFLSDLRRRLSTTAAGKLAHTLAKDLTNTPDHELASWLERLELDLDAS
jgi:protein required for attachment to host cells